MYSVLLNEEQLQYVMKLLDKELKTSGLESLTGVIAVVNALTVAVAARQAELQKEQAPPAENP